MNRHRTTRTTTALLGGALWFAAGCDPTVDAAYKGEPLLLRQGVVESTLEPGKPPRRTS